MSLSTAALSPRWNPLPYGPSIAGRSGNPFSCYSVRSHAGYLIYSDRCEPGSHPWSPRRFGNHGIYIGIRGYGLCRGSSYSNWTRSHSYYKLPNCSNIWCGALTSIGSRPS